MQYFRLSSAQVSHILRFFTILFWMYSAHRAMSMRLTVGFTAARECLLHEHLCVSRSTASTRNIMEGEDLRVLVFELQGAYVENVTRFSALIKSDCVRSGRWTLMGR